MMMSRPPAPEEFVLVLVTVPDAEAAATMAKTLVGERLAACVNVLPTLRSIYEFEGALRDDSEALCLVKTRRSLYPILRDRVTALHPYNVPEIIALTLSEGNAPYLEWLQTSTRHL